MAIIPTIPSLSSYLWAFELISVGVLIGSILQIEKFEYWNIGYLGGWLVGTGIVASFGGVEDWLFTLYAVVGGLTLFVKVIETVENISLSDIISRL